MDFDNLVLKAQTTFVVPLLLDIYLMWFANILDKFSAFAGSLDLSPSTRGQCIGRHSGVFQLY